jgi:hypothetical protein
MVFLLLGGVTLVALMVALGLFSGAQVTTVKKFGVWTVALGGLVLAALLFLSGRGAAAMGDLLMLGMLIWPWIVQQKRAPSRGAGPRPAFRAEFRRPFTPPPPPPPRGGMSRDEAYAVLGLKPGSDAATVRDAHKRLMRMAHPDNGGSDWLASRLNQARDILLA